MDSLVVRGQFDSDQTIDLAGRGVPVDERTLLTSDMVGLYTGDGAGKFTRKWSYPVGGSPAGPRERRPRWRRHARSGAVANAAGGNVSSITSSTRAWSVTSRTVRNNIGALRDRLRVARFRRIRRQREQRPRGRCGWHEHGSSRSEPRTARSRHRPAVATQMTRNRWQMGDFDGDKLPDLVVANTGSTDVQVYLTSGQPLFGQPTSYPTGTKTFFVITYDFDGDHKLDFAATSRDEPDHHHLLRQWRRQLRDAPAGRFRPSPCRFGLAGRRISTATATSTSWPPATCGPGHHGLARDRAARNSAVQPRRPAPRRSRRRLGDAGRRERRPPTLDILVPWARRPGCSRCS